jgi:hydroxyethylthiazole kinase-like uncharacterized protein yjeF
MQRAGLAVARVALAIAPHARTVWVACGPGNNGGDGFEAAMHLKQWGKDVVVTWAGTEERAPQDAKRSLQRARAAGVRFATQAPSDYDLALDALLGIGSARAPEGAIAAAIQHMNAGAAPVLAIDIPTGLDSDTGRAHDVAVRGAHTATLLALKPGLFTAQGRDAAGTVWFDDLQVDAASESSCAELSLPPAQRPRRHATHKGTYGDLAVIGGAPGMAGAALLAARAALHHGAGRVFVGFLDAAAPALDDAHPDLMVRQWDALDLAGMTVACGCGGGDAVRSALPKALNARALVLDADALNAIAADPQLQALLQARGRRGAPTVLTPHPLEAARFAQQDTHAIQSDRIAAARALAKRFGSVVVLKGSGSVVAAPDGRVRVNPTGNARLAIAGTGDVLAGWIAARLAQGGPAFEGASDAVYLHGMAADAWPADRPLTANALATSPWVSGFASGSP